MAFSVHSPLSRTASGAARASTVRTEVKAATLAAAPAWVPPARVRDTLSRVRVAYSILVRALSRQLASLLCVLALSLGGSAVAPKASLAVGACATPTMTMHLPAPAQELGGSLRAAVAPGLSRARAVVSSTTPMAKASLASVVSATEQVRSTVKESVPPALMHKAAEPAVVLTFLAAGVATSRRRGTDGEVSDQEVADVGSADAEAAELPLVEVVAEAAAETAAAPTAASRRAAGHRMLVRGLGALVPPHRLLLEYPLAQQVDVLEDPATGRRTIVMLTFPKGKLPAVRTSANLGCSLHSVVHAAEGSDHTRRRVYTRKAGGYAGGRDADGEPYAQP